MSNWTKKPKVPALHKTFAASYRYGFKDGQTRRPKQKDSYFSNEGARQAYASGHRAGSEERRELEKEVNNEWLR
jgi:hypothetical protein